MVEGRKSTRSYNCVLTAYKDTNKWKNIKKKILRHHPLPKNLPGFRQRLWMEDAVAQVSLLEIWHWRQQWFHKWEMHPSLNTELPREGALGGGGQTVIQLSVWFWIRKPQTRDLPHYLLPFIIPHVVLLCLPGEPCQGFVVFPSAVGFNCKQKVASQKQYAELINFLCKNHVTY